MNILFFVISGLMFAVAFYASINNAPDNDISLMFIASALFAIAGTLA